MKLEYEQLRAASDQEWLDGLNRRTAFAWSRILPQLPNEQIQRRFVGRAFEDAFRQSYKFVSLGIELAFELGWQEKEHARALDFGCGWGRISQTLYRYFCPWDIISVDVQQEALDMCSASGLACSLLKSEELPPLSLESGSLEAIFAYSVFSHLEEPVASAWFCEFERLLAPGGIFVATTRNRRILDYRRSLDGSSSASLSPGLRAISDPDAIEEAYELGNFVFRAHDQGNRLGAGYGEAFIPKSWLECKCSELFSGGMTFCEFPADLDQAVFCMRKV